MFLFKIKQEFNEKVSKIKPQNFDIFMTNINFVLGTLQVLSELPFAPQFRRQRV